MPAARPARDPVRRLAETLRARLEARAEELAAAPTAAPSPALGLLRASLPAEEQAALDRLRHGWHARVKPLDEPERTAADAIVATIWRQGALNAVEERLWRSLLDGPAPEAVRALAVLCRCRARLEKDRKSAERDLRELFRLRPGRLDRPDLNPERLEWLAAKLRLDRARAEAAAAARPAGGLRHAPAEEGPRHAAPETRPTIEPQPAAAAPPTGARPARAEKPAGQGPARPASAVAGASPPPAQTGLRDSWLAAEGTRPPLRARLLAGCTPPP